MALFSQMFYLLDLWMKSYGDHSNESYWAVLSCGTVYYAVQGGSNFWVVWMKSYGVSIHGLM